MTNNTRVWYLEKEEKIDDENFGFRKQRSKIDAISKMTTKVFDGFRRKEKTAAIFFDIVKAKSTKRRYLNNWEKWELGWSEFEFFFLILNG